MFLNSGIAFAILHSRGNVPSFVDRYVFPEGELVSLSKSLGPAEAVGFEVRDVESLREHYAMTLRQWCGDLRPMPTRRGRLQTRPLIESGDSRWRVQHTNFDLGRLISDHTLLAKPNMATVGCADMCRLVRLELLSWLLRQRRLGLIWQLYTCRD